jgi:hypothetical protein
MKQDKAGGKMKSLRKPLSVTIHKKDTESEHCRQMANSLHGTMEIANEQLLGRYINPASVPTFRQKWTPTADQPAVIFCVATNTSLLSRYLTITISINLSIHRDWQQSLKTANTMSGYIVTNRHLN